MSYLAADSQVADGIFFPLQSFPLLVDVTIKLLWYFLPIAELSVYD